MIPYFSSIKVAMWACISAFTLIIISCKKIKLFRPLVGMWRRARNIKKLISPDRICIYFRNKWFILKIREKAVFQNVY